MLTKPSPDASPTAPAVVADEADEVNADCLGRRNELLPTSLVPVRDVRLAVTMVGGVALAIYECGVAVELLRAVRGEGMYGLLKRLTQSHVIVDVMSGTSAGGINNICLAAALANGTGLSGAEELWIEGGDIDDLLQKPEDKDATTLFSGDGFYLRQIEQLFKSLIDTRPNESAPLPSCAPGKTSLNRELDLLVTGTYFEGQGRAYFDQNGSTIYTEDYNGVFRLQHRPQRGESHLAYDCEEPKTDGEVSTAATQDTDADPRQGEKRREQVRKRLERIARTTSSLPAVFEPSEVTKDIVGDTIHLPNEKDRPRNFLFDGGFLNNRPLDLALEAVYQRTGARETSRWVVFVEPVAVEPRPLSGDAYAPNALEAVRFWNQVPSRQSLTGCLTRLFEANRRIRDVGLLLADQRLALPDRMTDLSESKNPSTTPQLWARTCLRVLCDDLRGLWAEELGVHEVGSLIHTDGATSSALEAEQKQRLKVSRQLERTAELVQKQLEATCRDLHPDLHAPGGWELLDLDTTLLLRLIERARYEVRDFRFPTLHECAGERADIEKRAQRTGVDGNETVQGWVRELNHLQDLGEILRLNLGRVVRTLVKTPKYKKAASPQAAALVLRRLLFVTVNALFTDKAGTLGGQPRDRDALAKEGEHFRNVLSARSKLLCGALEGEARPVPLKAAWRTGVDGTDADFARKAALAGTNPVSLIKHLSDRANHIVAQIATALAEPLKATVAEAGKASPHESSKRQEELSKPFVWAAELLGDAPAPGALLPDAPARAGTALRVLDIHLYPTERASNLAGETLDYRGRRIGSLFTLPTRLPVTRPIKLMYVSPLSQQKGLSRRQWGKKIAGDGLGNTTGFMKRSWRANDILWGKLDTSVSLLDTLAEPERLERMRRAAHAANNHKFVSRFLEAVDAYIDHGDPLGTAASEARADTDGFARDIGPFVRTECWDKNRKIVEGWLNGTPNATAEQASEALKEALLLRHQMDTLQSGVKRVLVEDLTEYVEQQARGVLPEAPLRDNLPNDPPAERTFGEKMRGAASELAQVFANPVQSQSGVPDARRKDAEERADKILLAPDGENQARFLYDFFDKDYKVGEECVTRSIAPLISLHRGAKAFLLTLQLVGRINEKNTTGTFSGMSRAARTPLKLLNAVAWIVYSFSNALAQGSAVQIALLAALAAVIVVVPLGAFLNLFNPSTGTLLQAWCGWGIALSLAAAMSLFKARRRAALVWLLGAAGVVLMVSVVATFVSPTPAPKIGSPAFSIPLDWRLAISEFLLVGALLVQTVLPRDVKLSKSLVRIAGVTAALLLALGIGYLALYAAVWVGEWWRVRVAGPLTPTELSIALKAGLTALTVLSATFTAYWGSRLTKQALDWKLKKTVAPQGMVSFELAESDAQSVGILNAWTEEARYAARNQALEAALKSGKINQGGAADEAAVKEAHARLGAIRQSLRTPNVSLDDRFALAFGTLICCLLVWAVEGILYGSANTGFLLRTITPPWKFPYTPVLLALAVLLLGMGAAFCDLMENGALAKILDRAQKSLKAGIVPVGALGDALPRKASAWARGKFGLILLSGLSVVIGLMTAVNSKTAQVIGKRTASAGAGATSGGGATSVAPVQQVPVIIKPINGSETISVTVKPTGTLQVPVTSTGALNVPVTVAPPAPVPVTVQPVARPLAVPITLVPPLPVPVVVQPIASPLAVPVTVVPTAAPPAVNDPQGPGQTPPDKVPRAAPRKP